MRAAVGAQDVPGVVAIAATENGVLYEGVFGSRRLSGGPAKDAAMTRDTVFRIASMVKLITSVAALRLVEQGKLSLDGPLPEIDPAVADPQVLDGFDATGTPLLRPPKRPIALRHLLTHTSGFTYRLWDAEAIKYINAIEKAAGGGTRKLPRTPLMFDPGERWQYGTSIDWVGRIVESISGEPLETHFKQAHFRAARHEGYDLRDHDGAARARSERASPPAGRIAQARADGARAQAEAPCRGTFPAAAASIRPRRII